MLQMGDVYGDKNSVRKRGKSRVIVLRSFCLRYALCIPAL